MQIYFTALPQIKNIAIIKLAKNWLLKYIPFQVTPSISAYPNTLFKYIQIVAFLSFIIFLIHCTKKNK